MLTPILIFIVALTVLLVAAQFFTRAAEQIGGWLKLSPFVIGVFIVGIGTSLPELISGIISTGKGLSEIVPGNIIGASISNILLITGMAVVLNKKTISLNSTYIYIDLHFLLGSFFFFYLVAYDGIIRWTEAVSGILIFLVYSFYLIKGGEKKTETETTQIHTTFPVKSLLLLIGSAVGIYFGADYTISSLEKIALGFNVPASIVALTLLSLGTTLPELAVNISAIRQGKAEMAIGNILGSCIFNSLVIPGAASLISDVKVPHELTAFSLPVFAACGLLFYLLTQDKKISIWEGMMFICLYGLFILKISGG
ncbi:MAG TPA: sodium:calcium antiporter [Chitinophagaceae bacterium]|nr:sodium:calcium antiporter [Chitinophagaceae bacterium]